MTKARDLANIISTGVPNSLITLDAAEIPNISTDKLTTGTLANARVADLPTSKITSGTFADARISASSVTAHVTATDLTPVRQDILTLGLKQAIQENSTKFNLPNSAITKFEADADFDSSGSTTVVRNASEYISSASQSATFAHMSTTNTTFFVKSATTDGSTTFANSGGNGASITAGNATHQTEQYRQGTSSILFSASGDQLSLGSNATNNIMSNSGTNTVQFWIRPTNLSGISSSDGATIFSLGVYGSNAVWALMLYDDGTIQERRGNGWLFSAQQRGSTQIAVDTWSHIALVSNSNTVTLYINGVADTGFTNVSMGSTNTSSYIMYIGSYYNVDKRLPAYLDEIRMTSTAETIPAVNYGGRTLTTSITATGTALGTTNVPTSAVTDVSGVMLLKNTFGTNTLGTDVKVYFTANNSAWTEAASYTDAGTFSTGIKMIKLGKTTCTSGSDVRWKAVWANQVASTKEGHIYGIGLNY